MLVSLGNYPKSVAQNGETPLHGAAYTGRNSLVQFLVDNGASFDVKNLLGWTPLRIADGVQYDGFAKHQHGTAAFMRKLMAERGLPVPEFHTEVELNYLEALKYREKGEENAKPEHYGNGITKAKDNQVDECASLELSWRLACESRKNDK